MALTTDQLRALAGVLLILLVVLVYVQMKARKRTMPRATSGEAAGESSVHPFLSRFVTHEGDVVGEVVAVEGERMVFKKGGSFRAVPVAAATLRGEEVQISGDVDWAAADEAGVKWLAAHRQGADAEVAGPLTRSEDVRSPALEAFRRRERDAKGVDEDAEE